MSDTQAYIDLAKKLNVPLLISEKEFIGKTVKDIRFGYMNNHQYMISEDGYCLAVDVERGYYEEVTPVFVDPKKFDTDQWRTYIREFKDYYAKTEEEADEICNQLSELQKQENETRRNRF